MRAKVAQARRRWRLSNRSSARPASVAARPSTCAVGERHHNGVDGVVAVVEAILHRIGRPYPH